MSRGSSGPVRLTARERRGLEYRVRLRLGLADLVARLGVGDDPAARLRVNPPVLDERRADVDTRVEVPREREVPDRAAVRPAARGLNRVDDLPGADLRRAR